MSWQDVSEGNNLSCQKFLANAPKPSLSESAYGVYLSWPLAWLIFRHGTTENKIKSEINPCYTTVTTTNVTDLMYSCSRESKTIFTKKQNVPTKKWLSLCSISVKIPLTLCMDPPTHIYSVSNLGCLNLSHNLRSKRNHSLKEKNGKQDLSPFEGHCTNSKMLWYLESKHKVDGQISLHSHRNSPCFGPERLSHLRGRVFGWEDWTVPAIARDVIDYPAPTPELSLHVLPSASGQLSGISPLHLGQTSFAPVTQGSVCIPFLVPWNKALSLPSCHRSIGSPHSPSPCSAALHAAWVLSMQPGTRSICTLQLSDSLSDGQRHSAFSVSSWWPSLCQAVAPGARVDRDPVRQLGTYKVFSTARSHRRWQLALEESLALMVVIHKWPECQQPHHPRLCENTLTFPYQQGGPR